MYQIKTETSTKTIRCHYQQPQKRLIKKDKETTTRTKGQKIKRAGRTSEAIKNYHICLSIRIID